MAKVVKKKSSGYADVKVKRASSSTDSEKTTVDLVIETSIALQKVVTDLAVNMKKLSLEVSEMLELFKEATKSIDSEKADDEIRKSDIDELKSRLDELTEQNKVIAKGILLLESSISPKEKYPAY